MLGDILDPVSKAKTTVVDYLDTGKHMRWFGPNSFAPNMLLVMCFEYS